MNLAFSISPKAKTQLEALQASSKKALVLRISVDAGGCSGLKYALDLERSLDNIQEDDVRLASFEGGVVVTDPVSLPFLAQATLDHETSLMESTFTVKIPQAKTACGCGASFSI